MLATQCYSAGLDLEMDQTGPFALRGISRTALDYFESLQLQAMPAMQHICLRSFCRGKTRVATS